MGKQKIDDNIQTFTIPFMPNWGGEQVTPESDIVAKSLDYFKENFSNSKDFRLSEVENDRWYYFEDTKEWVNLGNNIKLERIATPDKSPKKKGRK